MKLRLRENSIRLRLLQSELRQLREIGNVSETITFGAGAGEALTYSISISGEAENVRAQIFNNEIEIFLPVSMAENWAASDQVGLYETQSGGEAGEPLQIIIEKDFVCVDRPADADNKDAFPHPKMKC